MTTSPDIATWDFAVARFLYQASWSFFAAVGFSAWVASFIALYSASSVTRGVRLEAHAYAIVTEALEDGREVDNVYREVPETPVDEEAVEQAIRKALAAPTDPSSTHPSYEQRFSHVRGIEGASIPPDPSPAWNVFEDRDVIEEWMSDVIRDRVRAIVSAETPRPQLELPEPHRAIAIGEKTER